jgi:hypothetical protein
MSINVTTTVTIDRTRLERLLRLPGGLVYLNMQRRVRRAEEAARRLAPGSMKVGISSRVDRQRGEITGYVTSSHPATIYVIKGTRPHVIRPVRAQALRFTVGGRVVYARIVHHPGTRPNDFLIIALRSAL